MSDKEFHYNWEWTLQSAPQDLWPLVSDTNRFNKDTGLDALELNEPSASGMGRRLRFKVFGLVPIEWDEEPFQWVYGREYGVLRRYTKGPVDTMRVKVTLTPTAAGGTHLRYQVWAKPKNLLGHLAIPLQIGQISRRAFEKAFIKYDDMIMKQQPVSSWSAFVRLEPHADARLTAAYEQLLADGHSRQLINKLFEVIKTTDDFIASQIRPYQLADEWKVPRREVLELCLLATRAGVLDFQWRVLCPMCRGAGGNVGEHLQDLHANVHCDSCNIDYTANFDRSVEVTFKPNPAIRQVYESEYCVAGPQVTPHIIAQQILPPQAKVNIELGLEHGRYRLRTSGVSGSQAIIVAEAGGRAERTFTAVPQGWPDDEKMLTDQPTIALVNQTEQEQLFVLERMAWSDQAVTAAEVTTLQKFRDLFSTEALRPGEQFAVGSVAILFTDLVDSTRLYNEIGDAPAFGIVLNHFDVLREVIDEEEGAIIKTIGDAVMAVFQRPVSAIRAMTKAQRILSHPPAGTRPLFLKAGIHYGPCIAVTLNDRLDYFGRAVNKAARLEKFASGNAVVITEEVRYDPEVEAFLERDDTPYADEMFSAALKGFDMDEFALWRVKPTENQSQEKVPS